MKFLKVFLLVLAAIIASVVLFFLFLTVTEFYPKENQSIPVEGTAEKKLSLNTPYRLVTWNTGYGCLGETADFFMDGGKRVNTATEAETKENIQAIASFIKSAQADIILLQETDFSSSRSHRINQVEFYAQNSGGFNFSFARNFKVHFIPYPLPPIGKVDSGILTLTRFNIEESTRIPLPCPFKYPVRLCNLKRCLLVSRLPVSDDTRELVLVNLHLEAYDDGEGKVLQTKVLLDFIKSENDKGNFVIASGDFNQTFSSGEQNNDADDDDLWNPGILNREDFNDFDVLFGTEIPTCRSLNKPYDKSENFRTYIIDGIIVSKNISVTEFKTENLHFKNTDHNPVLMEFSLR